MHTEADESLSLILNILTHGRDLLSPDWCGVRPAWVKFQQVPGEEKKDQGELYP